MSRLGVHPDDLNAILEHRPLTMAMWRTGGQIGDAERGWIAYAYDVGRLVERHWTEARVAVTVVKDGDPHGIGGRDIIRFVVSEPR